MFLNNFVLLIEKPCSVCDEVKLSFHLSLIRAKSLNTTAMNPCRKVTFANIENITGDGVCNVGRDNREGNGTQSL